MLIRSLHCGYNFVGWIPNMRRLVGTVSSYATNGKVYRHAKLTSGHPAITNRMRLATIGHILANNKAAIGSVVIKEPCDNVFMACRNSLA
jgi:hypothetical protein